MFTIEMTDAFATAASNIAQSAVKDAATKLAAKYGFDATEAIDFLLNGGISIKKPTIPRNALPWCGEVVETNCCALVYNSGLFTQCPQTRKNGLWCTKCANQVEKHGTPKNGDVEQRKACGLMNYKVGKQTVLPYGEYMKKHKYTREEVEAAAAEYGLTIDPVQFECKKRGRPTTTPQHMVTPLQELPEVEEPRRSERIRSMSPRRRIRVIEEEPVPEPKVEEPVPEPPKYDAELEEEDIDEQVDEEEESFTADEINKMMIADLRKLADSVGIPTKENGKAIKLKQLQDSVRMHFKV